MANAINWFELPANDFDRAVNFYKNILDIELIEHNTDEFQMAFFKHEKNEVGGAVIKEEGYVPDNNGSVVYLNGGNDLQEVLDRVEGAGGKVVLPKTNIGDNGNIAHFLDTEGNRVALHSPN